MNNKKQVIAYDADGVRIFGSVREAAAHYGLTPKYVSKLIHNGETTADGVSFDIPKVQF